MIELVMMCSLIVLIVVIGYIYFKNKHLKQSINHKKIINNLYEIALSQSNFKEKLADISNVIILNLHFDYVSFFINDKMSGVNFLKTNIDQYEQDGVLDYIKTELILKKDTQIFYTSDGFIPYGLNRFIKYLYYIPLIERGEVIGGILLEKDTIKDIKGHKSNLFKAVIDTLLSVFLSIVTRFNLKLYTHIDALTGAKNKRALYSIEDKLSDDYTVAVIEIDYFKYIKNAFNEEVCRIILKEFVTVLKQNCRAYDCVFRHDDDTFILLLKDTLICKVEKYLDEIRQIIKETDFVYEDDAINFTASFGVSDTTHSKSLEMLVKYAHYALLEAREDNGDQVSIFNF